MDLWHGCIHFDDSRQAIQDVHFSHPHSQDTVLPRHASLCFLAIVETANVPLCLAAGPSLDVWTNSETAQAWLHDVLIEDEKDDVSKSWWERQGGQSRYGVLLGVKDGRHEVNGDGLKITEVLLYAATSSTSQQNRVPPSPPSSSSSNLKNHAAGTGFTLRLYALPLSSNVFSLLDHVPLDKLSDATPTDGGFYLPIPAETEHHQPDSAARKRAKLETLFQDATQNRRLQKKRGGEGTAKATAGLNNNTVQSALPSPRLPVMATAKETTFPSPQTRGPLSRASTTGSITSSQPASTSSRPQSSRRPTLTNGQRSSLHRVESALSPSIEDTNSPVPEGNTNNAIEQQNKNTLSRIIMAGMRMYGFQPQRKKSVSSQVGQAFQNPLDSKFVGTAGQDEYKSIYHQTFKATNFVFRKRWAKSAVGQDVLRDTVDGFLGKFCRDPFDAGEDDGKEGLLCSSSVGGVRFHQKSRSAASLVRDRSLSPMDPEQAMAELAAIDIP